MQTPTQRIGLTGGIATGKTTVTRYLARHYLLPIFDADCYARAAVAPNSPILARICDRYGPQILTPDGQLDRGRLGQIVFTNTTERHWLEQQIHPEVRRQMVTACQAQAQAPVVVLAIPLLFEAQMTDLVSEIWVVTCTPDQQVQRLMARNGLTQQESCDRINSQMPLAEKIALADIVIDNSGDEAYLWAQVDQVLTQQGYSRPRNPLVE